MPANDGAKGYTVCSAKGMVAYKGVKPSFVFVALVLLLFDFQCHIQIAYTLLKPFCACQMTALPKVFVYLIFMNGLFKPRYEKSGNEFGLRS